MDKINFTRLLLIGLSILICIQFGLIAGLKTKIKVVQTDERWNSYLELIEQNEKAFKAAQERIKQFEAINQWLMSEKDSLIGQMKLKQKQLDQYQLLYHRLKTKQNAVFNYQDSSLMAIDEQLSD